MPYTSDWFSRNIPRWQGHLARFRDKPCNALELGSFEGRSAVWLLENILTHPESRIHCVDNVARDLLVENLSAFAGRWSFTQADATDYLIEHRGGTYDLVYVDADHVAKDVIMQAGLIWPMMNRGGVLIFDDYINMRFSVKPGVDFFLEHWTGHRVLYCKHQAMIERL